MDSQIISLNEELQDMHEKYNELRNGNASKNNMNDDTSMCERHEANYIQSEGHQNQISHDSYSHQKYDDRNDSEKSLTELNNDVKNDLEDFKRCIRSMRTVHWKLFARDDGSSIINLKLAKHTSLCFLDRWKSALRTSLDEDVRGYDVIITEYGPLIGKMYGCQDYKGMEKQHGVDASMAGGSQSGGFGPGRGGGRESGKSQDGFELEKTLDVTEVDVGCPVKVEMVRKKYAPQIYDSRTSIRVSSRMDQKQTSKLMNESSLSMTLDCLASKGRNDQTDPESPLLLVSLKTNLTSGQDSSWNGEQRVP
ncbi:hypothetical protein Tco_0283158 [Tanacetum coccineum]